MATATPGILIKSIHGKIGNLVFYYSRGRQCVRTHVIPRNPDTEAQRTVRSAFRDAVYSWQAMTEDEKHTYNRKARYMNMSGYNLYISKYMERNIRAVANEDKASTGYESVVQPLSFNRIPSVSKTYLKGTCINSYTGNIITHPG